MIPKNIHLIFLRKNEPFPELFEKCRLQIEANHLCWNILLYNEDDIQQILNQHLREYTRVYNSFVYNVQKADFLRLALVYIYGGFYMDLDMLSLKPLDELRSCQLVLGEEKTVSIAEQQAMNLKYRIRIANYMFGGIPQHPFLYKMMDEMAKRASIKLNSQQDILDITGPGLMTDTYWNNFSAYQDITLLRNRDKQCIQPYHNQISCHFGDYAAHLHEGTWRREVAIEDIK